MIEYVKEIRVDFEPHESMHPEDVLEVTYKYSKQFNKETPVSLMKIADGFLHIFNEKDHCMESYRVETVGAIMTYFYKDDE